VSRGQGMRLGEVLAPPRYHLARLACRDVARVPKRASGDSSQAWGRKAPDDALPFARVDGALPSQKRYSKAWGDFEAQIEMPAERAKAARKEADRLACEAWNQRMLGFQGPAQPSPTLDDALNAGYRYLEVKCLGCNTHLTVALDIVRRPKTTLYAMQRLLAGAAVSLQAQPSRRAAADQDFSQ
jgi:hypothetical protein